MKRLTALLLAMLLCLCLPGCQSNQLDDAWDEAVGATPQPAETQAPAEDSQEEEESTTRKLVIAEDLYTGDASIVALANEFMAMNKDVEISFDYEMDFNEYMSLGMDEYTQRRETYLTQLKTKLMTGEAPDIIFGVAGLNLHAMTQSGAFQDLSGYWARDMAAGDYFMPVVESTKADGKLAIIPFTFNAYMVYANRRVTDGLGIDLDGRDSITSAEMIEWYNQAREQGLLDQDAPMFFGQEPDYKVSDLYIFDRSSFLDIAQREAHFDGPEFAAFLDNLQALPDIDDFTFFTHARYAPLTDELIRTRLTGAETEVQNYGDAGSDQNFLDYVQQGKEGLFIINELSAVTARDGAGNPCEYAAGPFIVTDSQGQVQVLTYEEFAVSSNCKDPELAWAFIKHCISSRDSLDLGSNTKYTYALLSVNRANCHLQLEDNIKNLYAQQPGYSNLSWYWSPELDPEEIQAALDRFLDRPVVNYKLCYVPGAGDILDQFLTQKLIDAEQCAAKLQDQAYIWFNE